MMLASSLSGRQRFTVVIECQVKAEVFSILKSPLNLMIESDHLSSTVYTGEIDRFTPETRSNFCRFVRYDEGSFLGVRSHYGEYFRRLR